MAFEVTATRKRPQAFSQLTGQEFVVSTLTNALKQERIAHAYLFSGPRGVGKTSAARLLAKSLNCEQNDPASQNGSSGEPCGVCSHCLEIAKGNSLDVIEIDGASNTSVNDVRSIKDEVLFAPNSSRYKIYIIDEVHMLSNSAFNALLKTIEEPPPYIIFIFATTEIHKVPATIRSRCQQFQFRLIQFEEIQRLLRGICDEIGIAAEDDALLWIAKESTGSLRDAYTLFDQVVSFSDNNITLEKIREKLGLIGVEQINILAGHMVRGDRKAVLSDIDEILFGGISVEQFIVDLTDYFRNILLIKSGISRENILGMQVNRFNEDVINGYSIYQLEHGLELLANLYRDIRYSLNQRFELELIVSRLASLKDFLPREEMLARLEKLSETIKSIPASAGTPTQLGATSQHTHFVENSEKQTSKTQHSESMTDRSVRDSGLDSAQQTSAAHPGFQPQSSARENDSDGESGSITSDTDVENTSSVQVNFSFDRLLKEVRAKKFALGSVLEASTDYKYGSGKLTLVFDSAYRLNTVKDDKSLITSVFKDTFGVAITLDLELKKKEVKRVDVKEDERVELVKKVFRGEVVEE